MTLLNGWGPGARLLNALVTRFLSFCFFFPSLPFPSFPFFYSGRTRPFRPLLDICACVGYVYNMIKYFSPGPLSDISAFFEFLLNRDVGLRRDFSRKKSIFIRVGLRHDNKNNDKNMITITKITIKTRFLKGVLFE